MNLVYFVTGKNPIYHNQCYFSIFSFLSKEASRINKIFIYTDSPEFYEKLKDIVCIVCVDYQKIKEWRGEYDFFWRIKIKVIEDASLRSVDEPLLYMDTDTFLHSSLESFNQLLLENKASMHVNEGSLKDMKFTPFRMWKQIKDKSFGGVVITEKHQMWNAGVIALPVDNRLNVVRQALSICDDMCRSGVTRRLIEQYAISVAIYENYPLYPADNCIGHYWGNKSEWNRFIDDLFIEMFMKDCSLDEIKEHFKTIDYKAIPYMKRRSSTAKKLVDFVHKVFKFKEIHYIN